MAVSALLLNIFAVPKKTCAKKKIITLGVKVHPTHVAYICNK